MAQPKGSMQPNWFDTEFEARAEKATAEQVLAEISKDHRIVQAVKDALASRDALIKKAESEKRTWVGPTRTQTVRTAIVEVLQAAS